MFSRTLTIAMALSVATFSLGAAAQTCAQPASLNGTGFGVPQINDTTCGHETSIVSTCQSNFGAPGAAWVGQANITADGTFVSIAFAGGAGYTLASYLVPQASGCGNFACTTTGDATTPMLHSDIPPGSYYLIVTGADFDAAGACGTFTVMWGGFLPVALQSFSID
jgi:hypothetical protein